MGLNGDIQLSHHGLEPYTRKLLADPQKEWPNDQYPLEVDPPFISPFLSSFTTLGITEKVYYRRLDPEEPDDVNRMLIDVSVMIFLSNYGRTTKGIR